MKTPKMLLAATILAATGNVRAHDWYLNECCRGHDCAPTKVEQIPLTPALAQQLQTTLPSAMMITTKHGTVIVPSGFKAGVEGWPRSCVHHQGRLRAGAPDVPLAAAEHLME